MSPKIMKRIFGVALIAQVIGLIVLLMTDYTSQASNVAFWVVVSAGIVEVMLALVAKRKGVSING